MDNPYYRPPAQKKSNKKTPIIIISIIAVVVILGFVFIGMVLNSFNSLVSSVSTSSTTTLGNNFSGPFEPYIAKVSVKGTISSSSSIYSSSNDAYHHDWTLETIDALIRDVNNVALYLDVNTPGGGVYESDDLYFKIQEYKEETGRPVYVYMGSMAASGGYYISAPADKIFANRNTWTGSIGVIIGTLFDVSGFMEEHGIKAEDITSGANKGMGSYFEPMTDEQRAIYQSLVDEAYEQFVEIVAEGRGMDIEVVKPIADGRIYSAAQALENGLIDEICLQEDMEEQIRAEHENVIIYDAFLPAATSLMSGLLGSMNDIGIFGKQQDIATVLEMIEAQKGQPPILYMYQ